MGAVVDERVMLFLTAVSPWFTCMTRTYVLQCVLVKQRQERC